VPVVRDGLAGGDDQTGLVASHTLFNLLGGLIMLPLARPFARRIERLVPDRPGPLTEALDRRLLANPDPAIDAAGVSARAISRALGAGRAEALRPGGNTDALDSTTVKTAPAFELQEAWRARIVVPEDQTATLRRYSALLHEYDHLHRLHHRCTQTARLLGGLLRRGAEIGVEPTEPQMAALAVNIAARMQRLRAAALEEGVSRPHSAEQIFALTDSMRWRNRTVSQLRSIGHDQIIASEVDPAGTD
jgi:phosphate:Na+ symporter